MAFTTVSTWNHFTLKLNALFGHNGGGTDESFSRALTTCKDFSLDAAMFD
jgi:hypothetical protein